MIRLGCYPPLVGCAAMRRIAAVLTNFINALCADSLPHSYPASFHKTLVTCAKLQAAWAVTAPLILLLISLRAGAKAGNSMPGNWALSTVALGDTKAPTCLI